jgi:hypothetical protein
MSKEVRIVAGIILGLALFFLSPKMLRPAPPLRIAGRTRMKGVQLPVGTLRGVAAFGVIGSCRVFRFTSPSRVPPAMKHKRR